MCFYWSNRSIFFNKWNRLCYLIHDLQAFFLRIIDRCSSLEPGLFNQKPIKMKAILLLIVPVLLYSCAGEKEVQVEIVNVELVKIDTIYRGSSVKEQLLTWKAENNVQYVSYQPINSGSFNIGSRMKMMVKR